MQFSKLLGFCLFASVGCSSVLDLKHGGPRRNEEKSMPQREQIQVSISLQDRNNAGLQLTDAASFRMALDGCASGLAYPEITTATIAVYKDDTGCKVKLLSFVLNGVNWVPSVEGPFSTWATGDTAQFVNQADSSMTSKVVLQSQLNDPISGSESVAYAFTQSLAGGDGAIGTNSVAAGHGLSVSGQDAPQFTLKAISWAGMSPAGAGQFVFTLECLVAVSGEGASELCSGLSLNDIKYKLVKDTYGGTLSLAQAAEIFAAGGENTIAAGDRLALGAGGTTNGGFVTASGDAVLTGPQQMHANPNMLLVVQAANVSYRYFNIDVSTLSYP
jgi:hypothetical protein